VRPIFIDCSAFYAVLVKRDPAHKQALASFSQLSISKRQLCTTDHVIAETLTLLRARKNSHVCETFYNIVKSSKELEIKSTTRERFQQTVEFFLKYSDKGYSFTDCLSFIVMHDLKLTEALTTDNHFEQAGFTALLAESKPS
jgi:predicted nucleic acid-binding protein